MFIVFVARCVSASATFSLSPRFHIDLTTRSVKIGPPKRLTPLSVGFMEGEGPLKCCQVNLPEDDYMVNPRIKKVSQPLLLCDAHEESRTTLFDGGGS